MGGVRHFQFTAYVLGEMWEADREALTNACEADGPGRSCTRPTASIS